MATNGARFLIVVVDLAANVAMERRSFFTKHEAIAYRKAYNADERRLPIGLRAVVVPQRVPQESA